MTKNAPVKTSPRVIDALNQLRARELAVVTQYMRQHYRVTGAQGLELADEFKDIAITEMKHAEKLAERIDFLGGDPTTTPSAIDTAASTLEQMARVDLDYELDAVQRYRDAIKMLDEENDVTTRRMLEDILGDEEDHVNTFQRMLGE